MFGSVEELRRAIKDAEDLFAPKRQRLIDSVERESMSPENFLIRPTAGTESDRAPSRVASELPATRLYRRIEEAKAGYERSEEEMKSWENDYGNVVTTLEPETASFKSDCIAAVQTFPPLKPETALFRHDIESRVHGLRDEKRSLSYIALKHRYEMALHNYHPAALQYNSALSLATKFLADDRQDLLMSGPSSTKGSIADTVQSVSASGANDEGSESSPHRRKGPRQIEIDGKVYVSLPTAAKMLHVTHVTMHNWAAKKVTLSNGEPVNIVRDPVSKHRFISLDEVALLAHRFSPVNPVDNSSRTSLNDTAVKPSSTLKARRKDSRRSQGDTK